VSCVICSFGVGIVVLGVVVSLCCCFIICSCSMLYRGIVGLNVGPSFRWRVWQLGVYWRRVLLEWLWDVEVLERRC
jgi:hypothetical protein